MRQPTLLQIENLVGSCEKWLQRVAAAEEKLLVGGEGAGSGKPVGFGFFWSPTTRFSHFFDPSKNLKLKLVTSQPYSAAAVSINIMLIP